MSNNPLVLAVLEIYFGVYQDRDEVTLIHKMVVILVPAVVIGATVGALLATTLKM